MTLKNIQTTFVHYTLLLFIALLFPLLGTDNPTLVMSHMWLGFFAVSCVVLGQMPTGFFANNIGRITTLFFIGLLFFLFLRALWAFLVIELVHLGISPMLPLYGYMEWPIRWGFFLAVFFMGYVSFKSKSVAWSALNVMSWMGFFLAVNALPALLLTGSSSYVDAHHKRGFFFPFFYHWEWVPKYWMNRFAHPNYVGDVMAFGFFAALGLAIYGYHVLRLQKKGVSLNSPLELKLARMPLPFIYLRATLAIAMATAVFMLMSRGTIVSFVLSVIFIGAILCVKFFDRLPWGAVIVGALLSLGILGWAVNFEKVFKEVQSISREFDDSEGAAKSIDTNIEGKMRALAIHRAYPVWGVGTGGYEKFSRLFSFSLDRFNFADAVAMNHYLQTLAEEGIGAYFYFAFFAFYLIELVKGLIWTKSRFKFIASLTFFAPVFMVMIHASFNHLMEGFGTQTMVYLNMGASLSVLRSDFEHC